MRIYTSHGSTLPTMTKGLVKLKVIRPLVIPSGVEGRANLPVNNQEVPLTMTKEYYK